jgi:hypothetical protein
MLPERLRWDERSRGNGGARGAGEGGVGGGGAGMCVPGRDEKTKKGEGEGLIANTYNCVVAEKIKIF